MAKPKATTRPRKSAGTTGKPLAGQVAIVAGATRGAGRGIARGLGEAGATVYCTGRSTRGNPSAYNRPETVEETANLVTSAGGKGIPCRTDHTVKGDVESLVTRVEREQGRLDLLVNSIAGEDPILGGWTSCWETDLTQASRALENALLSHLLTAQHSARLMMKAKRGLIVEVTEGDMLLGGGNVLIDVVKSGLKCLAARMAEELRPQGVAVVAVTPGYLRSESMLQHFGVTRETWRDGGAKDPNFLESESPLFLGRGIAALARESRILDRTGQLLSSWELAREYGLIDEDGGRPDWGTHLQNKVLPTTRWLRDGYERHVAWLDGLAQRGKAYLEAPAPPTRRRGSRKSHTGS